MIAAPEAFYVTDDVAALFHAAKPTVTEWARRGRIPSVRFPNQRRVLFPRDEIERYAADPTLPLETVPLDGGGRVTRIAKRRAR